MNYKYYKDGEGDLWRRVIEQNVHEFLLVNRQLTLGRKWIQSHNSWNNDCERFKPIIEITEEELFMELL